MCGTCQPGGRRHLNGRRLTNMDPNGLQKPQFYCRRRRARTDTFDVALTTFSRVVCHDQHWLQCMPHRFHLELSLPILSHPHQPAGESHGSWSSDNACNPGDPSGGERGPSRHAYEHSQSRREVSKTHVCTIEERRRGYRGYLGSMGPSLQSKTARPRTGDPI